MSDNFFFFGKREREKNKGDARARTRKGGILAQGEEQERKSTDHARPRRIASDFGEHDVSKFVGLFLCGHFCTLFAHCKDIYIYACVYDEL